MKTIISKLMNSIQPIQMIGTQRSGSNLLRLLLNQYSEIVAPHPPHILQRFYPLLPAYGDLSAPENMARLTNDVSLLVECNPVPWKDIVLNREEIVRNCKSNNLIQIFRAVYDQMARCNSASMWICKSMANVAFAGQMEEQGLSPLYIYLYRDGRDVACSFKKAIVGEKHVYHIAQQWRKDQLDSLQLSEKIESKRFFQISYESLVSNPEQEMARLSNFLQLSYDPAIFDYYKSDESKNTSSAGKMWENVAKPIFGNNSKKYLKELTKEEIIIFESVAGDTLERLGYELEYPDLSKDFVISKEDIQRYNEENKILKEQSGMFADPEGVKLREPQDKLIAAIKSRIISV